MAVTGLDISNDMLAEAEKLRGNLFKKCTIDIGDARNLPYGNNSFDLIVCFRLLDGLLTFGDAKKVILECVRVSKKNLILELSAIPEGDRSEYLIQNLKEGKPMGGRLTDQERVKLFDLLGLKIIQKELAREKGKPHEIIYLCEKKVKSGVIK